ncbi:copper-binding protein [Hydrogenophaga sp.]|uniref:copper-binding protein n=1 Tax=Hydrogenophaga sp. TaxID=1904254 RepID=UPI002715FDF0|nr:copper-binding protein [Hydrogenophaga sp.]MDO9253754.1 copper-binding protein [Hydrogenophaga sp.]MDP2406314.1 copper-binding protein [Hydrogenophaga sp.]MDP3325222.1 copper-binding protein [Hydrogenophaga sp.]MDP3886431.1 copper-binding protein [Hydrogenophaga sp.]MDZ4176371.1 copper-binding protein [Hydrogenophaga sp.]
MNKFHANLAAVAVALSSWTVMPAFAQMPMDHSKMGMAGMAGMAAMPGMTDGEVKKIDKDAGKITIKHGEIKHMDMPGMTMVFVVKDKALLDAVPVGAKIQFMATNENGQMMVTDIQPAK